MLLLRSCFKRVLGNASGITLMIVLLTLVSCGGPKPKPFVSFYYWKSNYKLQANEIKALQDNQVQQLYVRYFDIVYDEQLKMAIPAAAIRFAKADVVCPIVPVVFIKNKVFEQSDSTAIDSLSEHTVALLNQINKAAGIKARALQIDCDWTSKTAPRYFYFLRLLRQKLDAHDDGGTFASLTMLMSTIRLHQVKYADKQGVPPVDKGVLMFYNMGEINTSDMSSIYNRSTGQKYLAALNSYRLPLDVALPIFAWGMQMRDGTIIALLNKMDVRDFQQKDEFVMIRENRFKAIKSFFKGGYYFKEGDEVKVEQVSEQALKDMADDLKANYPNHFQQVIFYDLDSINLSRYDQKVFQKTIARF